MAAQSFVNALRHFYTEEADPVFKNAANVWLENFVPEFMKLFEAYEPEEFRAKLVALYKVDHKFASDEQCIYHIAQLMWLELWARFENKTPMNSSRMQTPRSYRRFSGKNAEDMIGSVQLKELQAMLPPKEDTTRIVGPERPPRMQIEILNDEDVQSEQGVNEEKMDDV